MEQYRPEPATDLHSYLADGADRLDAAAQAIREAALHTGSAAEWQHAAVEYLHAAAVDAAARAVNSAILGWRRGVFTEAEVRDMLAARIPDGLISLAPAERLAITDVRDPAAVQSSPPTVLHYVMRQTFDGLYVFEDEDQAAAYAAHFAEAESGSFEVVSREAASRLLGELAAEVEVDGEAEP
jgi:hypothetical protein